MLLSLYELFSIRERSDYCIRVMLSVIKPRKGLKNNTNSMLNLESNVKAMAISLEKLDPRVPQQRLFPIC